MTSLMHEEEARVKNLLHKFGEKLKHHGVSLNFFILILKYFHENAFLCLHIEYLGKYSCVCVSHENSITSFSRKTCTK